MSTTNVSVREILGSAFALHCNSVKRTDEEAFERIVRTAYPDATVTPIRLKVDGVNARIGNYTETNLPMYWHVCLGDDVNYIFPRPLDDSFEDVKCFEIFNGVRPSTIRNSLPAIITELTNGQPGECRVTEKGIVTTVVARDEVKQWWLNKLNPSSNTPPPTSAGPATGAAASPPGNAAPNTGGRGSPPPPPSDLDIRGTDHFMWRGNHDDYRFSVCVKDTHDPTNTTEYEVFAGMVKTGCHSVDLGAYKNIQDEVTRASTRFNTDSFIFKVQGRVGSIWSAWTTLIFRVGSKPQKGTAQAASGASTSASGATGSAPTNPTTGNPPPQASTTSSAFTSAGSGVNVSVNAAPPASGAATNTAGSAPANPASSTAVATQPQPPTIPTSTAQQQNRGRSPRKLYALVAVLVVLGLVVVGFALRFALGKNTPDAGLVAGAKRRTVPPSGLTSQPQTATKSGDRGARYNDENLSAITAQGNINIYPSQTRNKVVKVPSIDGTITLKSVEGQQTVIVPRGKCVEVKTPHDFDFDASVEVLGEIQSNDAGFTYAKRIQSGDKLEWVGHNPDQGDERPIVKAYAFWSKGNDIKVTFKLRKKVGGSML